MQRCGRIFGVSKTQVRPENRTRNAAFHIASVAASTGTRGTYLRRSYLSRMKAIFCGSGDEGSGLAL